MFLFVRKSPDRDLKLLLVLFSCSEIRSGIHCQVVTASNY